MCYCSPGLFSETLRFPLSGKSKPQTCEKGRGSQISPVRGGGAGHQDPKRDGQEKCLQSPPTGLCVFCPRRWRGRCCSGLRLKPGGCSYKQMGFLTDLDAGGDSTGSSEGDGSRPAKVGISTRAIQVDAFPKDFVRGTAPHPSRTCRGPQETPRPKALGSTLISTRPKQTSRPLGGGENVKQGRRRNGAAPQKGFHSLSWLRIQSRRFIKDVCRMSRVGWMVPQPS